MDNKMMVGIVALGLAAAAMSSSWGQDGGNGGNGDNGDQQPDSIKLKLNVNGNGQARYVIDGSPGTWTSTTSERTVSPGTSVDVETRPDEGYTFTEYQGRVPPFTVGG